MFVVLYKWRIKPGKEQQFIAAWAKVTLYFREHCDSLGSQLNKGSDGIFYAIARWKSDEDRFRATLSDELSDARTLMQDAIEERFEEVIMEQVADYWI